MWKEEQKGLMHSLDKKMKQKISNTEISSCPEVLYKKLLRKISQISQNSPEMDFFFNEIAGLQSKILLRKHSILDVFLRILKNYSKCLFCRIPVNGWFVIHKISMNPLVPSVH